jgi:hypothetical protein
MLVRLQASPTAVDQAGYDVTYFRAIHGRIKSNVPIKIGNDITAQQLLVERFDDKFKTPVLDKRTHVFGV